MAWAPTYATIAELKAYVRAPDSGDDVELDLALEAASRAIDHATNRQFGATDAVEQRVFEACWSPRHGRWRARIDDVMTAVGLVVTVAGSAVAAANYDLTPTDADKRGRPWEHILLDAVTSPSRGAGPPTVAVDATFGWSAVPDTVKQACLLQAARVFSDRNAPQGIAGAPDAGALLRLMPKLHPTVEATLVPFRRDWPMML